MNGEVVFHDRRCLRMRSSRASCEECAKGCPLQAITIGEGPVIDQHRCVGCLLCTVSCPTGALVPREASLFGLLTARKGIATPVIGCLRDGVAGHLRFPCLGGIPEEAILALLHFSPHGQLNLTGCRGCPRGFIREKLQDRFGRCQEIMPPREGMGLSVVTEKAKLNFADLSYNRREFFRAYRSVLFQGATDIDRGIRGSFTPTLSDSKGPPERRQLLNRVMTGLAPEKQQPLLARYYFELSLQDTCDLCFACGGVCPTGALEASYGNPPALLYRGALCVGCGLCREICPQGALSISGALAWAQVNTCRPLVPRRIADEL